MQVGRGLMWLAAVGAALFALLAWQPLSTRGLWEIVIASKVVLAGTGLVYTAQGGIDDAGSIVLGDGA